MGFALDEQHDGRTGDQLYDARQSSFGGVNVGRVERWWSLVAGGLLAGYALKRRSVSGAALAAAGAALLYRGGTGHCPGYAAAGVNRAKGTGRIAGAGSDTRERLGGTGGLLVDEAVTIGRDVGEVYLFWRNFENLPRFMEHLERVIVNPDGTSTWTAKGRAGVRATWTARIINEEENRLIGWQSVTGSTVATAGSVNFESTSLGTTVRVRFQYDPPAGKAGAALLALLGEDPAAMVREDLARLKVLLETRGDATAVRYSPAPPVH